MKAGINQIIIFSQIFAPICSQSTLVAESPSQLEMKDFMFYFGHMMLHMFVVFKRLWMTNFYDAQFFSVTSQQMPDVLKYVNAEYGVCSNTSP